MILLPLARAMFCVNCEAVSDTSRSCPACGSLALMSLSRLINRPAPKHRTDAEDCRRPPEVTR